MADNFLPLGFADSSLNLGSHLCCFYEDKAEQLGVLMPFFIFFNLAAIPSEKSGWSGQKGGVEGSKELRCLQNGQFFVESSYLELNANEGLDASKFILLTAFISP